MFSHVLMFILVKATKELMSDKDENVKLKRRLKVKREKWQPRPYTDRGEGVSMVELIDKTIMEYKSFHEVHVPSGPTVEPFNLSTVFN